jgi:hypothetical protein
MSLNLFSATLVPAGRERGHAHRRRFFVVAVAIQANQIRHREQSATAGSEARNG